MTKKETVALFALIASLYPRDEKFAKCDPMMRDAWAEMLADIPFDVAKAAIKATVATSPFPPAISEIRDYATRMTGERRLTADEAWGLACEAIRNYGTRTVPLEGFSNTQYAFVRFGEPVKIRPSGVEYEAKRHLPPEVWEILKRMGYRAVCESEEPDVIRGQFMRAWTSHDQEQKEVRVMQGVVPEILKAITGEKWEMIGQ